MHLTKGSSGDLQCRWLKKEDDGFRNFWSVPSDCDSVLAIHRYIFKKLSRQFPGICTENGIAEDSSTVDIVHNIIPAGYWSSSYVRAAEGQ